MCPSPWGSFQCCWGLALEWNLAPEVADRLEFPSLQSEPFMWEHHRQYKLWDQIADSMTEVKENQESSQPTRKPAETVGIINLKPTQSAWSTQADGEEGAECSIGFVSDAFICPAPFTMLCVDMLTSNLDQRANWKMSWRTMEDENQKSRLENILSG